MIRLTLRTLLAYLDDTLPPAEARAIGAKLASSAQAQELADRLQKVIRKRSLSTPATGRDGSPSDPNIVAAYLSDTLPPDIVSEFEKAVTESDVHLAELAACHQILTLVLSEQIRVPPLAYRRMYKLVSGPESIPTRRPNPRLPVSGTSPIDGKPETDDADAPYLLGLPAYSRRTSGPLRLLPILAALLLLGAFGLATFMLWPHSTSPTRDTVLAANTTEASTTPVATTPAQATTPTTEAAKSTTPATTPKPMTEVPMVTVPMPDLPKVPEKVDLQPAAQTPKPGRIAVAKSETADSRVIVVRQKTTPDWTRLMKGEELFTSDQCVCLPGYIGQFTFESGLKLEPWANITPELQSLPFLESGFTLNAPDEGFSADCTLHTGRIYFSTSNEKGEKVRLRLRDEIWDLQLDSNKTELAVEAHHQLMPGANPDRPLLVSIVHAMKGTATLKQPMKPDLKIPAGEVLMWDSASAKFNGPQKPGPQFGKEGEYFVKVPVYQDAKLAKPMLDLLDQFSERLKKAKSVKTALAELRADPTAPPTPVDFAGSRFGVLSAAAIGDLASLTDDLNDGDRADLNAASVFSLRHLLATYPEQLAPFKELAMQKLRLNATGTKDLLHALHGLTAAEKTDLDFLLKLADQLNSPVIAQRGAALYVLVSEVDPKAATRIGLLFNLGDGVDVREAAVKAWKKNLTELLKVK